MQEDRRRSKGQSPRGILPEQARQGRSNKGCSEGKSQRQKCQGRDIHRLGKLLPDLIIRSI
ncbi:hypothetical protein AB395_0000687 [Sinorhizobium fredii CCBAU 45436]|nr:hypothetical protein AB395_0000687 [Sinorhizobium fredii CCBAU 45436]